MKLKVKVARKYGETEPSTQNASHERNFRLFGARKKAARADESPNTAVPNGIRTMRTASPMGRMSAPGGTGQRELNTRSRGRMFPKSGIPMRTRTSLLSSAESRSTGSDIPTGFYCAWRRLNGQLRRHGALPAA